MISRHVRSPRLLWKEKYFKGANIIVENQPGGGGAIGQAYVAKTAPADGYTLLTYTASAISNPILKQVPFTVDDFKIVICPNTDPVVTIARKDAPFNTVDEMLEYAKTISRSSMTLVSVLLLM